MSTHDSKNGLSNRGRPRLEVSPQFNGEESEFCPRFYTIHTPRPSGQNLVRFAHLNFMFIGPRTLSFTATSLLWRLRSGPRSVFPDRPSLRFSSLGRGVQLSCPAWLPWEVTGWEPSTYFCSLVTLLSEGSPAKHHHGLFTVPRAGWSPSGLSNHHS
jgi:hypothetical protein